MADLETLARMFDAAPIPRWMGARLTFAPDRAAIVTLTVRAEHLQATGVAHGSILTFVADTSAWFTAAAAVDVPITTAGFTLNLLRPAVEGDALEGRSSVVKAGRTLVVVRTQVLRAGGPVAEGTFTHAAVRS